MPKQFSPSAEAAHLGGVEAGERGAEDLKEVAGSAEGVIHVVVVGVRVVAVPVEDVVAHVQAVPGEVCRRVAQGVVLVPQHAALPAITVWNLVIIGDQSFATAW